MSGVHSRVGGGRSTQPLPQRQKHKRSKIGTHSHLKSIQCTYRSREGLFPPLKSEKEAGSGQRDATAPQEASHVPRQRLQQLQLLLLQSSKPDVAGLAEEVAVG